MRSFNTGFLLTAIAISCAIVQANASGQERDAFLAADKELTRFISQAVAGLSPVEADKLKRAQEAWVLYRDACAASEAAFYSEGSSQNMVGFTVMRELTEERLQRLKRMLADAGQPTPGNVPAPKPAPVDILTQGLTSPAVNADIATMREQLNGKREVTGYLDLLVPSGKALDEVLASQKLNPQYLEWIKAHPEAGQDIVRVAVAGELRARAMKDEKAYKEENLLLVTQFNQKSIRNSQLGQIAGEFAVKPLQPYKFFVYVTQQNGLKELTEAYIAAKTQGVR